MTVWEQNDGHRLEGYVWNGITSNLDNIEDNLLGRSLLRICLSIVIWT